VSYGHLTLYETCEAAVPSSEVAAILHREARAAGFEIMDENGSIGRLVDRMAFLVENRAEGFTDLSINRVSLLEKACAETASFSGLRNEGLGNALRKIVPPGLLSAASGLAPDEVTLPAGRKVKVHYEPGKPPWIESQIQDFFGMMATPPVLGGRMVMVVHLLAPSRRPVQVTSDLEGFWKNHYPSVRKELSRRYPKHYWPEDGAAARPPVKTR
jgi:ATP-dependent helicase HrpB